MPIPTELEEQQQESVLDAAWNRHKAHLEKIFGPSLVKPPVSPSPQQKNPEQIQQELDSIFGQSLVRPAAPKTPTLSEPPSPFDFRGSFASGKLGIQQEREPGVDENLFKVAKDKALEGIAKLRSMGTAGPRVLTGDEAKAFLEAPAEQKAVTVSKMQQQSLRDTSEEFYRRVQTMDSGLWNSAQRGADLPFLGYLKEARVLGDVLRVAKKEEAGQPLSPDEDEFLNAYATYTTAAQNFDPGFLSGVIETVSGIPTFAAEFLATGGGYAVGKKAAIGLLTKVLGRRASRNIVVRGAERVVGSAAGAAVQAAMIPMWAPEMLRRQLPSISLATSPDGQLIGHQLDRDEEGKVIGGDDSQTALLKSLGSAFIQTFSERAGWNVQQASAWIKKRILSKYIQRHGLDAARRTAQKFGYNGIFGEVFEEEITRPFQAMLDDEEFQKNLPFTNPEELLTATAAFSIFGPFARGAGIGLTKIGRAVAGRVQTDEAAPEQENLLTPEEGFIPVPPGFSFPTTPQGTRTLDLLYRLKQERASVDQSVAEQMFWEKLRGEGYRVPRAEGVIAQPTILEAQRPEGPFILQAEPGADLFVGEKLNPQQRFQQELDYIRREVATVGDKSTPDLRAKRERISNLIREMRIEHDQEADVMRRVVDEVETQNQQEIAERGFVPADRRDWPAWFYTESEDAKFRGQFLEKLREVVFGEESPDRMQARVSKLVEDARSRIAEMVADRSERERGFRDLGRRGFREEAPFLIEPPAPPAPPQAPPPPIEAAAPPASEMTPPPIAPTTAAPAPPPMAQPPQAPLPTGVDPTAQKYGIPLPPGVRVDPIPEGLAEATDYIVNTQKVQAEDGNYNKELVRRRVSPETFADLGKRFQGYKDASTSLYSAFWNQQAKELGLPAAERETDDKGNAEPLPSPETAPAASGGAAAQPVAALPPLPEGYALIQVPPSEVKGPRGVIRTTGGWGVKGPDGKYIVKNVATAEGATMVALDRIAKGEAQKKQKEKAEQGIPSVPGVEGEVDTPRGAIKIRYRLVDVRNLKTSHDPFTFAWTPNYPKFAQERDYSTDRDGQIHVQTYGRKGAIEVEKIVTKVPIADVGPSVSLPDGTVMGANSRTMMAKRAYTEGKGEELRAAIRENALLFGFTPEQVDGVEQPWIDREVLDVPEGEAGLRKLSSDLNAGQGRAKSAEEDAVSAGQRISLGTLEWIGAQLAQIGEETTVRDLMRVDPNGVLERLNLDGAITDDLRNRFVDRKTNTLSEKGKDFFEEALLAKVVDDPNILAYMPKSAKNNIERSLGGIARLISRGDEWDIREKVKEAADVLRMVEEEKTTLDKWLSHFGEHMPLTDEARQEAQRRAQLNPITVAIARKLQEKGKDAKKAFALFGDDAAAGLHGQTGMFFQPRTPHESFNEHFGANTKPSDWYGGGGGAAVTAELTPPPVVAETIEMTPPPPPSLAEQNETDKQDKIRVLYREIDDLKKRLRLENRESERAQTEARMEENRQLIEELEGRATPAALPETAVGFESAAEIKQAPYTESISEAVVQFLNDQGIPAMSMDDVSYDDLEEVEAWSLQVLDELKAHYENVRRKGRGEVQRILREGDFVDFISEEDIAGNEPNVAVLKFLNAAKERIAEQKAVVSFVQQNIGQAADREAQEELAPPPESVSLPAPPEVTPEQAKAMSDEGLKTTEGMITEMLAAEGLAEESRTRLNSSLFAVQDELRNRTGFGKENVVVTEEEKNAALNEINKFLSGGGKQSQIIPGAGLLDPRFLKNLVKVGTFYFEGGLRVFATWAQKMIHTMGDGIRPYLPQVWKEVSGQGVPSATQADIERISPPPNLGAEKRPGTGRVPEPTAPKDVERGEPTGATGTGVSGRGAGRSGGAKGEGRPRRAAVNVPGFHLAPKSERSRPPVKDLTAWQKELTDAGLPENMPPPTRTLSPDIDKKLIFQGQSQITQAALSEVLDGSGSFVIASTTGSGKTFTGAAVVEEVRRDMKDPKFTSLVLTNNADVAAKWIRVLKEMGVQDAKQLSDDDLEPDGSPKPGVYIASYAYIGGRPELSEKPWSLVVADESGKARRWYTTTMEFKEGRKIEKEHRDGKMLMNLGRNARKTLYLSATPFHNAMEIGYAEPLGLWKDIGFQKWVNQFGVRTNERTGQLEIPYAPTKMLKLREQLIERGQFVNFDRLLDGFEVNIGVVPMTPAERLKVADIRRAFELARQYFEMKRRPMMIMGAKGNEVNFIKAFLERTRLPQAIELGKKLENEGWKVAFFSDTKSESAKDEDGVYQIYEFLQEPDEHFQGEISRLLPPLPSVVKTLEASFGDTIANYSGPASKQRSEELRKFSMNEKKHLYATYGAGGMGVDMHDEDGNHPRAVIYVGLPWSGIMLDQAIGRPWRFGSKSNVVAYILSSDSKKEIDLVVKRVWPRLQGLRATVSGIESGDPVVKSMQDLESAAGFMLGGKGVDDSNKGGTEEFQIPITAKGLSNYAKLLTVIPSAEAAKQKGMKVIRRDLQKPPGMEGDEGGSLFSGIDPMLAVRLLRSMRKKKVSRSEAEDLIAELREQEADEERRIAEAAVQVDRKRWPDFEGGASSRLDPRSLDTVQQKLYAEEGTLPPMEAPPDTPDNVVGKQQIPPPGRGEVPLRDLAFPGFTADLVRRFVERGRLKDNKSTLAEVLQFMERRETKMRLFFAHLHTMPYTLRSHNLGEDLANAVTAGERNKMREVADLQFYIEHDILKGIARGSDAAKRIDEALRTSQNPMDLVGAESKFDGQPFSQVELQAAQRIRDEIFDPLWERAKDVRPNIGYLFNYSSVLRDTAQLMEWLHPQLRGKLPEDIAAILNAETRAEMEGGLQETEEPFTLGNVPPVAKDPFSPFLLRREATPPKRFNIHDVTDAYVPSILKVVHDTPTIEHGLLLVNRIQKQEFPYLRETAERYLSNYAGVAGQYPHIQQAKFINAREISQIYYRALLEMNLPWFVLNLTQSSNTWAVEGKYVRKSIERIFSPKEARHAIELVQRAGVMTDLFVHPETRLGRIGHKISTTRLSEFINRSIAYIAGLESAKDKGLLGPKEKVGEITYTRLMELAAEGVDVSKAMNYAYQLVADTQFMYSPAYVQFEIKDHPFALMFKSYPVRQYELTANLMANYKSNPQAAARIGAILLTQWLGTIYGIEYLERLFPYGIWSLLGPPVVYLGETVKLISDIVTGDATQAQFERWLKNTARYHIPGGNWIIKQLTKEERGQGDETMSPPPMAPPP